MQASLLSEMFVDCFWIVQGESKPVMEVWTGRRFWPWWG